MAAVADLTRGPVLLGVSITTALIALSSSGVRFFLRARPSEGIGADDYAIGVATLLGSIGAIFTVVEGVSMKDSPMRTLEFDVLASLWFLMATALAKISICLFFVRIMGGIKMWRVLLRTLIILIAVINFTFVLTTNLQCRPLERLWNLNAVGSCWDPAVQLNMGYFRGAISVFVWLFMALFPVLIVRDLEIDRSVRWSFYFLSSLSLVAGVFATVRTYEISQTPAQSGIFTYAHFISTVLAILEQNIGIVAANVLPIGPLLSRPDRGAPLFFSKASHQSDTNISNRSGRAHHYWWRASEDEEGGTRGPSGPFAQLKDSASTTTLVIEGPRRESFELGSPVAGKTGPKRADSRRSNRSVSSSRAVATVALTLPPAAVGSEAWPKGIIKTVEVQVVEENISDIGRPSINQWDQAMPSSSSRGN